MNTLKQYMSGIKTEIPLKEGYMKSQVEWHYKQKKNFTANYDNESYLDSPFR